MAVDSEDKHSSNSQILVNTQNARLRLIDQLHKPLGHLFSVKTSLIIAKDWQLNTCTVQHAVLTNGNVLNSEHLKRSHLLNMNWQKHKALHKAKKKYPGQRQNKGSPVASDVLSKAIWRYMQGISLSLWLIFRTSSCICSEVIYDKLFQLART